MHLERKDQIFKQLLLNLLPRKFVAGMEWGKKKSQQVKRSVRGGIPASASIIAHFYTLTVERLPSYWSTTNTGWVHQKLRVNLYGNLLLACPCPTQLFTFQKYFAIPTMSRVRIKLPSPLRVRPALPTSCLSLLPSPFWKKKYTMKETN